MSEHGQMQFEGGMVLGAILGVMIGVLIASWKPDGLRADCEATLPRDQKCVMQFVPQPSKD